MPGLSRPGRPRFAWGDPTEDEQKSEALFGQGTGAEEGGFAVVGLGVGAATPVTLRRSSGDNHNKPRATSALESRRFAGTIQTGSNHAPFNARPLSAGSSRRKEVPAERPGSSNRGRRKRPGSANSAAGENFSRDDYTDFTSVATPRSMRTVGRTSYADLDATRFEFKLRRGSSIIRSKNRSEDGRSENNDGAEQTSGRERGSRASPSPPRASTPKRPFSAAVVTRAGETEEEQPRRPYHDANRGGESERSTSPPRSVPDPGHGGDRDEIVSVASSGLLSVEEPNRTPSLETRLDFRNLSKMLTSSNIDVDDNPGYTRSHTEEENQLVHGVELEDPLPTTPRSIANSSKPPKISETMFICPCSVQFGFADLQDGNGADHFETSDVRSAAEVVTAVIRAVRRNQGTQALIELRTLLDLTYDKPRSYIAALNLMGVVLLMRGAPERRIVQRDTKTGENVIEKEHSADHALSFFKKALVLSKDNYYDLDIQAVLWYNIGCCYSRRKSKRQTAQPRRYFRLAFAAAMYTGNEGLVAAAQRQMQISFLFQGKLKHLDMYELPLRERVFGMRLKQFTRK